MTLDRTWLLGVASAERVALGRTIQYTAPEFWDSDGPIEGWRLRDVVALLAAAEVAAAAVIGDEAPTEIEEFTKSLPRGDSFDADAFGRWAVERRAEQGPVSLALDWGKAADLLLGRASKLTDEQWSGKVVSWLAGDIKVGYLVQSRVAEWYIHGEDLRAGGQLPPRMEHPAIFATCDLAVRMIPYALEVAGQRAPGKSVHIELEAVGGGTWHQGTGRGEVPEPNAKPDAWITGRAHPFALVAAKRADLDVCLYDGLINIGGDRQLAETILRSLRVFA